MKEKFWLIHRFFILKDDSKNHSTEYFNDYENARKRYYNILASDLNNPDIIYQSVEMVDAFGRQVACDYFDRYQPDETVSNVTPIG